MNEQRNERRYHGSAGFTLIEILLVVVIIGMLASIAVVNIPKFLGQGRDTKAMGDVSKIAMMVEAYNMNEGKYPSGLSALTDGNEPYLQSIPKDPWGRDYQYTVGSSRKGLKFEVYSMGEDGSPSDDDIGNWVTEKKN